MAAEKKKISPTSNDDSSSVSESESHPYPPTKTLNAPEKPSEQCYKEEDKQNKKESKGVQVKSSQKLKSEKKGNSGHELSLEERQDTHLSKSKEMKKKHQERSSRKAFHVGLRLYLFRRVFWKFYLQSRRRQSIRVSVPANNKYLEKDSQRSSSKQDKMDKNYYAKRVVMTIAGEDSFEDYSGGVDTQPSWRPPMPIEDGIWKPIHVKTNGEGRESLWDSDVLIEVYDVKVDLCGKASGNIHGTIIMDCTTYLIYLFNRDKESALMIHKKGSLPLNSPDRAPLAYERIMTFLDLNIDDDLLCRGVVTFNPIHHPVNKWLCYEYKERNCSVHVTLSVMESAWLAELDVKLIKTTEDETVAGFRIHGDIIAYINDMPYLRDFIFSKKIDDCSTVKSLESISLSRSLFCCRDGSSIVVKVDLWNSDTNEPFVRGALLFSPEYYGDSDVGKLSSQYGEIQIKVNWSTHLKHPKTREAIRLPLLLDMH
ncbi:uncharacterized protein LOC144555482 isoform X2 [Carex rostrata]